MARTFVILGLVLIAAGLLWPLAHAARPRESARRYLDSPIELPILSAGDIIDHRQCRAVADFLDRLDDPAVSRAVPASRRTTGC
jgi:hypothetical protein